MRQIKNNKILEAVNRGIKLALDDYEDIEDNNSISHYNDVIDAEDYELTIIKKLYKKIDENSFNADDLKRILIYYKITKIKYQPSSKKILRTIIDDIVKITSDINLNWIDISNLTDLTRLFAKLPGGLTIDCSEWDTRHVENFSYIFGFSKKITIKANNWQFDNAKDFNGMFYMTSKSTNIIIDADHWNSGNVITMRNMYHGCKGENLLKYAKKLDISSCMDFTTMFSGSVCAVDLSNWEIPNSAEGLDGYPFEYAAMFDNVSTMNPYMLPKIVTKYSSDPTEAMFLHNLNKFCEETGCMADSHIKMDKGCYVSCNITYPNGDIGQFVYHLKSKIFDADAPFFTRGWLSARKLEDLIEKVNLVIRKKLRRN